MLLDYDNILQEVSYFVFLSYNNLFFLIVERRDTLCKKGRNNLDFGFASVKHMSYFSSPGKSVYCDHSENLTLGTCQQSTIDKGYLGNVYTERQNECCYYNISSTNRHFKHLWQEAEGSFVSERLCFNGE